MVKIVLYILFMFDCKGFSSCEIHLSSDLHFCPIRGPEKLELGIRAQA